MGSKALDNLATPIAVHRGLRRWVEQDLRKLRHICSIHRRVTGMTPSCYECSGLSTPWLDKQKEPSAMWPRALYEGS